MTDHDQPTEAPSAAAEPPGRGGGAVSVDPSIVEAILSIGNTSLFWQRQAELMEAQRNQAFADLVAAQSRADGYALLVGDLRAALENVRACVHVQEHGGYVTGATPADQCDRWVCDVVNRALAAPDRSDLEGEAR